MSGMRHSCWGPSGAREGRESWLDCVSVFAAQTTSFYEGKMWVSSERNTVLLACSYCLRTPSPLPHSLRDQTLMGAHELDFRPSLELLSQVHLAVNKENSHVWSVCHLTEGFYIFSVFFVLIRNAISSQSTIKDNQHQKFVKIFLS